MITELLLLIIAAVAVGGIYIAFKEDDEFKRKKIVTIVVVIIVAMTATLIVFSDKTRDIETGQKSLVTTLQQLLGYKSVNGYNPYLQETWGGIDPLQDFDYDGIINMNDHDIDNDGVNDQYEQSTKYNPMAPDIGIQSVEVRWLDDNTIQMKVRATPTTSTGQAILSVYMDDMATPIQQIENFQAADYSIDIVFSYDTSQSHKVELSVVGAESRYANKANNVWSYTIPSKAYFVMGQWYSDIESQIQGVIRNTKFIPGTVPLFGLGEDSLRGLLAQVPLWFWVVLIIAIALLVRYYIKSKQKEITIYKGGPKQKKRLRDRATWILEKLRLIKKKPPEAGEQLKSGDINVEMWRRKRNRR